MRFVAWYCYKCGIYFRELELRQGKRCPECGGSTIPQPMKTKDEEEPELLKAIVQIAGKAVGR